VTAALGGCAALDARRAADTEKLLAAAGFRRAAADSADPANLNTAPREIVPHSQGGKLAYTYADPDGCRCIYVGGPQAYAKYRELARSEAIAADMSLGHPNSAATMVWPGLLGIRAGRPPTPGTIPIQL
jgi:hypothetical protein